MYLQDKVTEASGELRARAANLANAAAARLASLRRSLGVLGAARFELRDIARRHTKRFLTQNSPLLVAMRKDVSDLARSTYRTLTDGEAPRSPRARPSRKRTRIAA